MSGIDEVRAERLKKLELLKAAGINPYVATVNRSHEIAGVLKDFSTLESSKEVVTIVGRVMVVRGQGAIMFVVIQDATGKLQAVLKVTI